MKTPYFVGDYSQAAHGDVHDDDELRELLLKKRLSERDDTREINVVTIPFAESFATTKVGNAMITGASLASKSNASWAMHWAIQVGDQYFELQRAHYDPTRTGLRMGTWDKARESQIRGRFFQGHTALTDEEILETGKRHFSRLNRMHINKYDIWRNNCQVAVDLMLRDIGGLFSCRSKLESLHEWIRTYFCQGVMWMVQSYYSSRGCDSQVFDKYEKVLRKALTVMTSRSMHYPKRQWIREDMAAAEGVVNKLGAVGDHWFLTVIESSLCLRQETEGSYVRRGADGKPELNFEAMRGAVKGIFDDKKGTLAPWLKAVPWLAAGAALGTMNWAIAVITIACQQLCQYTEKQHGIAGGLEQSMAGVGVSPKIHDAQFANPKATRLRAQSVQINNVRRAKAKKDSIDSKLVPRYERRLTDKGVPYYLDHMEGTRTWTPPEQQELCIKIVEPLLSKKWEERRDGDRTLYYNHFTEEITDTRPGPSEIWAIKKRVAPSWVKSSMMALPHGWEVRYTEEGDKNYIDNNDDLPKPTDVHPMKQEIEDERAMLLPEWNVEWDEDRGKKYRNLQTSEIRWKALDGPSHPAPSKPEPRRADSRLKRSQTTFVEPLPPGWTFTVESDGQKVYKNFAAGIERTTHPLNDKRRRLLPDWEMRYTPGGVRYWVHAGADGRGTTWWTRNRLLKNTSLKNDARGWKLRNNNDWEWFEGGDVPHKEIPLRDLDDPIDVEFREYPFLLLKALTQADGTFIEPLPANWVLRTQDGEQYYWNYKTEQRSDQHPNEDERDNLPGVWEMRYTRHGRQYYIDYADGSTWWTHPRTEKHEQQRRARPGQGQNGWKLIEYENGKRWERFEEGADMAAAEASELARTRSPSDDKWRSTSFSRQWFTSRGTSRFISDAKEQFGGHVGAIDLVANAKRDVATNAKTRFQDGKTLWKKARPKPAVVVDPTQQAPSTVEPFLGEAVLEEPTVEEPEEAEQEETSQKLLEEQEEEEDEALREEAEELEALGEVYEEEPRVPKEQQSAEAEKLTDQLDELYQHAKSQELEPIGEEEATEEPQTIDEPRGEPHIADESTGDSPALNETIEEPQDADKPVGENTTTPQNSRPKWSKRASSLVAFTKKKVEDKKSKWAASRLDSRASGPKDKVSDDHTDESDMKLEDIGLGLKNMSSEKQEILGDEKVKVMVALD